MSWGLTQPEALQIRGHELPQLDETGECSGPAEGDIEQAGVDVAVLVTGEVGDGGDGRSRCRAEGFQMCSSTPRVSARANRA
jgi:hypothetical protein